MNRLLEKKLILEMNHFFYATIIRANIQCLNG